MEMTVNDQQPIAAAPAGGGVRWWDSSVTYIIGGMALMLGVIPLALMIVAYVCIKSSESSNDEKSEKPVHVLQPEMEPRIVVIMAGEVNPTHIAKPAAAIRRGDEVV